MPIYEQTYKRWEGHLVPRPATWWIIAKTGIRLLWKKGLILLIILSSIYFLILCASIYIKSRLSDVSPFAEMVQNLRIDARFFERFLHVQGFYLMFVMLFSGAGLIANDRKFKALQIYFSKPLGFWDYIGGKFLVIGFYGSLVSLIPALFLFIMQLLFTNDGSFLRSYYWLPFSIMGSMLLVFIVFGGLILALSAAMNARTAAILFFGILYFSEILRKILGSIPEVGLFSLSANLKQIGSLLFATSRPFEFSVIGAWAVIIGVIGICFLILRLRIRPTEVMK